MKTDRNLNRKAAQVYGGYRRAVDALLIELNKRLNEHANHLFTKDGVRGGHIGELGRVCVRLDEVVDLLPPARKET